MLYLAPTALRLSFRNLPQGSGALNSALAQNFFYTRKMSTGNPNPGLNLESYSYNTASGVTLSDQQKILVASVLDLFAGKPSLEKLKLWKDDGTFTDPLTIAVGRAQFEAQWYGLKAAFSEIKPLKQDVTSSGNPISIDMSTMYKLKGIGKETTINSVVLIHVDEAEGKISKVEDKWNGKLPESSIANVFRKLNAVVVPKMISVPKSDVDGAAK